MSTLDDIDAGVDTVMTPTLVRLFKAAGCSPTECHACGKTILAGQIFKLVTHRKIGDRTPHDEMCCGDCGEPALFARDRKMRETPLRAFRPAGGANHSWAGFSRPSKV